MPEGGRRVEQAEAGHARPGRTLDPVGVGDLAAQHLEATADAEHRRRRAPRGRRTASASPLFPQPGEVGDRRPGAGQHDHVGGGAATAGRSTKVDLEARLEAQRVEVGEVADPWEPHHGDAQPRPGAGSVGAGRSRTDSESSESSHRPGSHGSTPRNGRPVTFSTMSSAGPQQAGVAPELVDHQPGDQRLVGLLEQREGAVHGREHPATVDVADQQRRHPGVPRQPHVDVVVRAQVDLGRAAGSLADHDVEAAGQVVERRVRRRGERRPGAGELARVERGRPGRP